MVKLTKKEFCDIINRLQKHDEKMLEIDRVLETVLELDDLSTLVIELLEKLMDIDTNDVWGSDIGYYCYELNFGKEWKPSSLTDMDGNSIDISTPEKLYDYIAVPE